MAKKNFVENEHFLEGVILLAKTNITFFYHKLDGKNFHIK